MACFVVLGFKRLASGYRQDGNSMATNHGETALDGFQVGMAMIKINSLGLLICEIADIFDILPIHHNKSANYKQS